MKRKGFSLVELLVVMVLLALLAIIGISAFRKITKSRTTIEDPNTFSVSQETVVIEFVCTDGKIVEMKYTGGGVDFSNHRSNNCFDGVKNLLIRERRLPRESKFVFESEREEGPVKTYTLKQVK